MRIGIDAYGTRGLASGLGHYARQLLRAFLRDHPEHEYVVYCQQDERAAFDFPEIGLSPSFHCGGRWHRNALLDVLWHNLVLPILVERDHLEALFVTVDRRIPYLCRVPTIGTVHDLAAFTVNDKYPATRQLYSRYIVPRLIARLDRVLTISDATRHDLVRLIGLDPDRISRVYHGIDAMRFRSVEPSRVQSVLAALGVRQPYLLYVARLEHPGKNHVGLIEALARIEQGRAAEYQIVFVGSEWHGARFIRQAVQRAGLEGRVAFTGYVADEELPALYAGAELFVLPSMHEGFGLPVLEAMAAGVPLAVAKAAALPEVAGPAAEYFDPSDSSSIAAAIERLASDRARRCELIKAGRERVRCFTWEICAMQTLLAIAEGVLQRGRAAY